MLEELRATTARVQAETAAATEVIRLEEEASKQRIVLRDQTDGVKAAWALMDKLPDQLREAAAIGKDFYVVHLNKGYCSPTYLESVQETLNTLLPALEVKFMFFEDVNSHAGIDCDGATTYGRDTIEYGLGLWWGEDKPVFSIPCEG